MEMIVETARLFLRKMNMGDYDALYQVLADMDIIITLRENPIRHQSVEG